MRWNRASRSGLPAPSLVSRSACSPGLDPGILQQLANHRVADLVAELFQFSRKPAQALTGPAQRRHRIASRAGLDQPIQVLEQSRIRRAQRFAPASATANGARRCRRRRLKIFQAPPDRARRYARHTRDRRYPAIPRRLGLRSGEQATLSLVEVRQDCRLAPTQRIFIEHPSSYDAALSSGIPLCASNRNPIQLFPDGLLVSGTPTSMRHSWTD